MVSSTATSLCLCKHHQITACLYISTIKYRQDCSVVQIQVLLFRLKFVECSIKRIVGMLPLLTPDSQFTPLPEDKQAESSPRSSVPLFTCQFILFRPSVDSFFNSKHFAFAPSKLLLKIFLITLSIR